MLEIFLAEVPSIIPPKERTILLYDPVTNTDLTNSTIISNSGTYTVDNTVLIHGYPTAKWVDTTGMIAMFKKADILNLTESDWTYEFEIMATASYTDYRYYFWDFLSTAGIAHGLRVTIPSTGNYRQYSISSFVGTDLSQSWRIPGKSSDLVGLKQQIAFVCLNKHIRIYVNGVWQSMANGSVQEPAFTQQEYPVPANAGYLQGIRHGWFSSSALGVAGNRGRIRISNFARYTGNYTPGPLEK